VVITNQPPPPTPPPPPPPPPPPQTTFSPPPLTTTFLLSLSSVLFLYTYIYILYMYIYIFYICIKIDIYEHMGQCNTQLSRSELRMLMKKHTIRTKEMAWEKHIHVGVCITKDMYDIQIYMNKCNKHL